MMRIALDCLLFVTLAAGSRVVAAQSPVPVIHVYKVAGRDSLTAHVFAPANSSTRNVGVILLHGGGWAVGSPRWTYGPARGYVARGAVAIAIQYRLSNRSTITPADAVDDVRDAMRWVRRNAATLRVDPDRIIAHGVSAGGHLAAMLAESEDAALRPKALVLWSPGVAAGMDPYFIGLMGGDRERAMAISPDEHVRPGMPPTVIFSGAADSIAVTPPISPDSGSRRFCGRITQAGGRCEIHSYPHLGHLLTRRLDRESQRRGAFDWDPEATADAEAKTWRFLESLGYLVPPRSP